MNIKPILVRLQNVLGREQLIDEMVLLKDPNTPIVKETQLLNLVVGYNGSQNSNTALDLALLIAHQTHLATKVQAVVQVVYVVEGCQFEDLANIFLQGNFADNRAEETILKAKCLVEEWKSPFKAHLRFGCVATELRKVVLSEGADLLLLGCQSVSHPIVQKLGSSFPCPILGIPSYVGSQQFRE